MLIASLVVVACGEGDGVASPGPADASREVLPCDETRGLMAIQDVLADPDHPCRDWVNVSHVRAARVDDVGSAAVLTRRTDAGPAILTTAAHVLSPCWSFLAEQPALVCPESLRDPTLENGTFGVRLAEPGGGPPRGLWSAAFPLFNVETPREDLAGDRGAPRFDFSLYVVGSEDVEPFPSNRVRGPAPLVPATRALDDPSGVTLRNPSWEEARSAELVLLLGFPGDGPHRNELVASVGRVLSDDEARAAIVALQGAGDEEGEIPYDAEAEFLMEGSALPGMSGGGVFSSDHRQVGIAVRASFGSLPFQIVRVVRLSYVVASVEASLAQLTGDQRAAVLPYLQPGLAVQR